MISYTKYDEICESLPQTTKVIQWGGAHVWKVGGKVFAIGGWSKGDVPFVTFKCTPLAYEILQEQKGLRPAPYLAARGGKWIQIYNENDLDEEAVRQYIHQSYTLIVQKLTKKMRSELNVEGWPTSQI